MNSQDKSFERVKQKGRTRAELLRAAGELAAQGLQPTVADVADHAGISRATAYRYFSNPEDLIREAVLDRVAQAVHPHIQKSGDVASMPDAVDDLLGQVFEMVSSNEAMFRSFLASSVTGKDHQKRGARRLGWLDSVLSPLRDVLMPADYQQLLHSLSLLTGIETLVVMKDICGLDNEQTVRTIRFAARAMVQGALDAAGRAKA